MFVCFLFGIAIEAVLLLAVLEIMPLRPLCELLLAPGWIFVRQGYFTLVLGLVVNAAIYSIPFETFRRFRRAKGQQPK